MQPWILLLLFVQTPTSYEMSRLRMEESITKQRESVRQQAIFIHLYPADNETPFFSNPWPRVTDPGEIALASPICDPLPRQDLERMITHAAKSNKLPDLLIRTVIHKESAGDPCVLSTAGAMGLMQLMPETAQTFRVRDPWNPVQNIEAGSKFLKQMLARYEGNLSLALAAYNAGPGNVDRYEGVPPFAETQNYVEGILRELQPRPGDTGREIAPPVQ